jgi:hypothetical protein
MHEGLKQKKKFSIANNLIIINDPRSIMVSNHLKKLKISLLIINKKKYIAIPENLGLLMMTYITKKSFFSFPLGFNVINGYSIIGNFNKNPLLLQF